MKPKCLEISCFFPSLSLNFSILGFHVDMKPGQKKEGFPCYIATAKPSSTSTWPLLLLLALCGARHHKETPALDIFLPTATYLWIHLYILCSCFYCKKGTFSWNEVSLADKIEDYCPMVLEVERWSFLVWLPAIFCVCACGSTIISLI